MNPVEKRLLVWLGTMITFTAGLLVFLAYSGLLNVKWWNGLSFLSSPWLSSWSFLGYCCLYFGGL